jgi:hypothetical protein
MGIKRLIFVLLLLPIFPACNGCDEELVKVCPPPVDCIVNEDGAVETLTSILKLHTELGECSLGRTECDEETNLVCVGYVKPTLEECNDLDDDCDGLIDNGISWDKDNDGFNSMNSCLSPSDCDDNNDKVNPQHAEICDGIDNNCDAVIDDFDPVECWTGGVDAILDDTTPCKTGTMECTEGAWTSCQDQVLDELERCDGADNNCNGIIDDDPIELQSLNQRVCGISDTGICAYGLKYCVDGDIKCFDAVMPMNEVCNDLDDDCDGTKDENLFQPCESICGPGMETCLLGRWVFCDAPQPTAELCDEIDNDCDGEIDEGCLCIKDEIQVCREDIYDTEGNLLNCGFGMQVCDEFGVWGTCIYQGIEPEICDNWDNDCDGEIDGIVSMCGNNPNLHGIGQCLLGTTTCEVGEWGNCIGEIGPEEEVCDGIDNDCDGEIDEELNAYDQVDMIFVIDISGSMCPYIEALYEGILGYLTDFEDTDHRFGLIIHPSQHATNAYGNAVNLTGGGLVDAATFSSLLSSLGCHGGGWERTTDVIQAVVEPTNPLGIHWRSDSFPYVISISDEGPQTSYGNTPTSLSHDTADCQVAGCQPGDTIEIYFIDAINYLSTWLSACFGDPDRTIDIHPPAGDRYTEILRDIFQDVCF